MQTLELSPGLRVLDGTLGGAGHGVEAYRRILPGGRFFGCDLDPGALETSRSRLGEIEEGAYELFHGSTHEWLESADAPGPLDRVFFDLGMSSYQIDHPNRGFSFRFDAPLDMRMNPESDAPTASRVLNELSERELSDIFWKYGDERHARRIARAIVSDRGREPFERAPQLAALICRVTPRGKETIHPATRVFQALRIYVNDEIGRLERSLESSWARLVVGGRLAVITFHSLEARTVRRFAQARARSYENPGSVDIPELRVPRTPDLRPVHRKSILPSESEALLNPRARSAQLRVFEKIGDA